MQSRSYVWQEGWQGTSDISCLLFILIAEIIRPYQITKRKCRVSSTGSAKDKPKLAAVKDQTAVICSLPFVLLIATPLAVTFHLATMASKGGLHESCNALISRKGRNFSTLLLNTLHGTCQHHICVLQSLPRFVQIEWLELRDYLR